MSEPKLLEIKQISFEDLESNNINLKYAVIVAQYQDKYIFVRNKERVTWEIAGGKKEEYENILDCANRELIEETGANNFNIEYIGVYSVEDDVNVTYGGLFFADVFNIDISNLHSEIEEVMFSEIIPDKLTYPLIQPDLFNYVISYQKHSERTSYE